MNLCQQPLYITSGQICHNISRLSDVPVNAYLVKSGKTKRLFLKVLYKNSIYGSVIMMLIVSRAFTMRKTLQKDTSLSCHLHLSELNWLLRVYRKKLCWHNTIVIHISDQYFVYLCRQCIVKVTHITNIIFYWETEKYLITNAMLNH